MTLIININYNIQLIVPRARARETKTLSYSKIYLGEFVREQTEVQR